jgi:hypothetical protein
MEISSCKPDNRDAAYYHFWSNFMRLARIATCILCSSAAFAFQGVPPIKMGLWEMTNVSTMTATGKMADAMAQSGQPMGKPTTQSMKLCLTEDTWQKALANEARAGCVKSNVVMTSQKYALTMTCTVGGNTVVANVVNLIDSPTQIHGTVHLVSNSSMGQMTSDGTGTGKFLSSDCGDVKPLGTVTRPPHQ